jgi:hypothetical protein
MTTTHDCPHRPSSPVKKPSRYRHIWKITFADPSKQEDIMNMRSVCISLVATAGFLVGGCATSTKPAPITDVVLRSPQLSTLGKLVESAGLADTLRGAGPFTLFAPSDEAFKAVPQKTMQELASNPAALKSVLTYHAVPGQLTSASVQNGNVKTLSGANLAISKAGAFVTVEDAMVTVADIAATNGTVHIIDRVLMPPR